MSEPFASWILDRALGFCGHWSIVSDVFLFLQVINIQRLHIVAVRSFSSQPNVVCVPELLNCRSFISCVSTRFIKCKYIVLMISRKSCDSHHIPFNDIMLHPITPCQITHYHNTTQQNTPPHQRPATAQSTALYHNHNPAITSHTTLTLNHTTLVITPRHITVHYTK